MKKRVEMTVEAVQEVALDTIEMILSHSYIAETAKPGQFLHLLAEGHTLRRPISIASINKEQGTVTILFKIIGSGTRRLAIARPGMSFDVVGPTGNGFTFDETSLHTALLIGGGIGVPPLYGLAEELHHKGIEVKTILGFQTKDYVFYKDKFEQFGKTYVVTDDGSTGHHGLVTDILDEVGQFDVYYSCGPVPMLKALTHQLHAYPGFISLEERMGCGTGACLACVIPSTSEAGYKKICTDGPVFAANEVIL
ncbi:dihydroorotate dehydrogenase electron transfer subunit [Lentibacillus cibarius]|uniref:Dihydroorotate dehydrogenase B (NAD(+)), electron transfer subunit n=1 Tax=Lentibacillus cibarius TaxID=2583219 RepID=A0A5S3QNP0_9BACI|nr:dihydroorotate dehydrogenase electron transfer subunit [Lentibacillus cibarius]TMN23520.1 dihydroorotate dehydrogenase electron transfer subunit [Lentibacillus cibarius]